MRRHRRTSTSLDDRLVALREACELARGRLDDPLVARADTVVTQAGSRLGLGVDVTVVALAGPTGAGKSSLFNALAGDDLAPSSHLRPTTATPTAAIWGAVGGDLLDWLEVPRRHHVGDDPDGLVLLDLPDFDSIREAHRAEAERVVGLADLTIWVTDPQKYADAVLHDRYLRPLARHADAMLVVLNQVDRLDERSCEACVADLGRLLEADGLRQLPVLATSAVTGSGLDVLREELHRRVDAREAAATRLAADVDVAVDGMAPACGGSARTLRPADHALLVRALADAAGAPVVVRALARAHRRRGALATGWPYVRWLRRLRPDPLRRLRIDGTGANGRSSMAPATAVQEAQVDTAVRSLAATAAEGLAEPWPRLLRAAALRDGGQLPAALERAVAQAELPVRRPLWWRAVNLLQWLLVAASLLGGLWLLALSLLAYLQLDEIVPTPEVRGLPLPTTLLLGGLLLGLLLATLAAVVNRAGARRRARAAGRLLEAGVAQVGRTHVLEPLEAELATRDELCAALDRARR